MFEVLIVWILIGVIASILGRTTLRMLYGNRAVWASSLDMILVSGLCVCNIMAQILSLFIGLGMFAFMILIAATVLSIVYLIYSKDFYFIEILHNLGTYVRKRWMLIIPVVGVLLWTDIVPTHYDTYLYHAQAIHWIEEYGVTPGLGNLHFRLAYNSAAMPLQALFSFKWLTGQSLHAVNGFFTIFMFLYIVCTVYSDDIKETRLSDLLKLGTLLYVFYDAPHVSSPNTDTIALLLTYYIVIKWSEFYEQQENEINAYSFLCVLSVYAATLKLSVGIIALLTIYPAVILIKEKRIKDIIKHILLGVLLLCPYLIRNIITSGYVLYPYENTGIDSLDWIMPKNVLKADRAEIIAWGRGNFDTSRIGDPIWKWIGQWYGSINILWKVLFVLTIVSLLLIVWGLVKKRKEIEFDSYIVLIIVSISGLGFWLFTAPLPRYGTIYMIILPCIKIFGYIKGFDRKHKRKSASAIRICLSCLYIVVFLGYCTVMDVKSPSLLKQADYENHETYMTNVSGIEIALPVSGDQTGYDPFPSAPYPGNVEGLKLRGTGLKDGFR